MVELMELTQRGKYLINSLLQSSDRGLSRYLSIKPCTVYAHHECIKHVSIGMWSIISAIENIMHVSLKQRLTENCIEKQVRFPATGQIWNKLTTMIDTFFNLF